MNSEIFYRLGKFVGYVLKYLVYVCVIVGFLQCIRNRQVPFTPLTLMLVYSMWHRVVGIFEYLVDVAARERNAVMTPEEVENIINIVNYRNSRGFGPN